MNTKGIKFLAVLAVMVMAFAAIVALAPADNDVVAVKVFGNPTVIVDPTVITDSDYTEYYISEDAVVKIKGDLEDNITFYVQNGVELEVDIKAEQTNGATITIMTVTGDQQRLTTSTVDGTTTSEEGKIKITKSAVTFDAVGGQSVVYNALMPTTVDIHTTSTSGVYIADVTTGTTTFAKISATDVLYNASIGAKVAVAAGQSIQTDASISGFSYGVKVVATDEDDVTTYTYYATGANAGTAVLTKTGDIVEIKSGSVTVNVGTAVVKATSAKKSVTVSYGGADQVDIGGTFSAGTMTVSGKVKFASGFDNSATLTLNNSADVVEGSVMAVNGKLILKNDAAKIANLSISGSGDVIAENKKLWTYTLTDPNLQFASIAGFTGMFDVNAINETAYVDHGFSTATIEKNQTFIVTADTFVTTALTVHGVLIINEGVTVTITKTQKIGASIVLDGVYAQIINNGQILIQGTVNPELVQETPIGLHITSGTAVNNGKIVASSDSNLPKVEDKPTIKVGFTSAFGKGLINNGTITTSKNDAISLDNHFENDGSVSVGGLFTGDGLVNAGTFTLNNAKIGNLNVNMSAGATFAIVATEMESATTLTINNAKANGSISFTAPSLDEGEKCSIRNITVTDISILAGDLALSGNATTSVPDEEVVGIATAGNISVLESFTVGSGYSLNLAGATNLYVFGQMTLTKDVAVSGQEDSMMVVTGTVTCANTDKLLGIEYLAAKYIAPTAVIYTTLENAISGAAEAEITLIDVGSIPAEELYPTIDSNIVVPAGMTIVGTAGTILFIDDEAVLAVEENAMLSFDSIIVVSGILAAADANNVNIDTVVADVKTVDADSNAASCMNLEVALELATAGDVIALSNDFYAADTTLVIPEGVTVDATAAEDATDFVLVNSDLVVNGYLIVDKFAFIATTDDTIGITVNGYIYDSCPNGSCFTGWWYTPFGVSYFVTDDEDQTWYVLTTIENIQPAINVADDAKVTVEGDAVLDELTVSGRDDMPAEVTFSGNVDIDNINIDDVTLIFSDGTQINTTVKNAVGSITITGAYVDYYLSIYDMAIYSTEDVGVYMEGMVTDNENGTYGILFEGITGMDGTDVKTAINYGYYNDGEEMIDTPAIIFDGVTTIIGKKVYINEYEVDENAMATVTGTLYVDHASRFTVNSDMQVLGSFLVAERSDDGVAGAAELNGDLFVGILKSEVYSVKDAVDAYAPLDAQDNGYGQYMLAASAVVSGNVELAHVTATDAKPYFITVLNGSVIDDAIIEDLTAVDINIDSETWITIYGYGETEYSLDGLKAPVVNAEASLIVDAYDEEVADFNYILKVVINSANKPLNSYGGYVDFYLNYDIFNVKIKTDGSVKAVYIDGILMETGQSMNIFMMANVAAGTHKVTVEAATGYDADKCVLYTEMGTILPGMAFTFTEYDCEVIDSEYVVTYNINGTEIQPEPVPPTPEEESQWTVTTILLVILVVLIAIMAVIVALRLNRS